jgi:hypothetical protein
VLLAAEGFLAAAEIAPILAVTKVTFSGRVHVDVDPFHAAEAEDDGAAVLEAAGLAVAVAFCRGRTRASASGRSRRLTSIRKLALYDM